MDLEPKDALISTAAFTNALQVLGSGRGGKPKEELLKGAGLASYAGKRARKGKPVEGLQKVLRVLAA
jgi:topoisomerase-4 subunit A